MLRLWSGRRQAAHRSTETELQHVEAPREGSCPRAASPACCKRITRIVMSLLAAYTDEVVPTGRPILSRLACCLFRSRIRCTSAWPCVHDLADAVRSSVISAYFSYIRADLGDFLAVMRRRSEQWHHSRQTCQEAAYACYAQG